MLINACCTILACVVMTIAPPASDSSGDPQPMTEADFASHVHALGLEGEAQAEAATLFSDYAFERSILDQAYRAWQNWSMHNEPHNYAAVEENEKRMAIDGMRYERMDADWNSGIRRLEDEYFVRLAEAFPAKRDDVVRLAQSRLRAWAIPEAGDFAHYQTAAGATFDLVATLQRLKIDMLKDSPAWRIITEHARMQDALLRELDMERRTRGVRWRPFTEAIRANVDAIRASGLESKHPLIEAYAEAFLPTYRWSRELRTLNQRTISLLKAALDADSFGRLQDAAVREIHPYVFDHAPAANLITKALARKDLKPQQRSDLEAIDAALAAEMDAAKDKLASLYDQLMSDESSLELHRTNALAYLYKDQAPRATRPGKQELEAAVEAWKVKTTTYRQQALDALTPGQREEVEE